MAVASAVEVVVAIAGVADVGFAMGVAFSASVELEVSL